MIVAFLTPWDIKCGIAEYSKYFVSALTSLGLDIRVIKLYPSADRQYLEKLYEQINKADISHIQYDYSFFKNYNFNHFMRSISIPNIVTLHEEYPATDFPKGFNALNPYYLGGYFYRMSLGRAYYKILNTAVSKFLVHSDKMKKFLINYGASPAKIEVFPHPVPSLGKTLNAEKSKQQLSASSKIVLTIFGFINNRKGYEVALNALCGLPEKYVLIIAGDNHPNSRNAYAEKLKKQVKRLGLTSRVRFTGFIPEEDLTLIMSATDIILAPFMDMSNSGSLSMAISYGKAVITSDLPPNRQLYEEGKCIELFKKGGSSDLKRAVTALMDDPVRKGLLEDRAKNYGESHSYQHMAEALYSIYRQLFNG